jgi:hypothetical protein
MNVARRSLLGKLPAARGRSLLVEENQTVSDIMSMMAYSHKQNAANYDKIAAPFWEGNVYDTARKLFDFCKTNIHYSEEPEEIQTIKTPARILTDGIGDCKHYASFIGGVLDALKRKGHRINWFYRFASYRIFDSTPGHVFVVVKDQEGEIWIDPVLKSFDYHKPYSYATDRKASAGKIGGCGCQSQAVGATGSATVQNIGGAIMAVAPALVLVVPVGTIVAVALEVVGGLMKIVGGLLNNYKTTSSVRWLTQLYQKYVLGQNVNGSQEVNENYTLAAQSWFSIALGVPIYDRYRFNSIKGAVPGWTKQQAITDFLHYPDTRNLPLDAVSHAYDIAQTMNLADGPGAWANFAPANIILTPNAPAGALSQNAVNSLYTQSQTSAVVPQTSGLFGISWIWIAAGGGLLLLMSGNKKRYHA